MYNFVQENKQEIIKFLTEWKQGIEKQALSMRKSDERDNKINFSQKIQEKITTLQENPKEKKPPTML